MNESHAIPRRHRAPLLPSLAILVLAAALAWAGSSLMTITSALRTRAWPTAPGTIEAVDLVERKAFGGVGGSPLPRPFYLETWQLDLRYTYTVDGYTYHGTRLVAARPDVPWRGARAAAHYRAGGQVQVHYNPADPSDAGLELRWPIAAMISLGAATGIVVFVIRVMGTRVQPARPRPSVTTAA